MILINFEGIDGSGKSSVSQAIEEQLRDEGVPCVHTRAHSQLQSTISRDIRDLSRNPNALMMAPWTEALLYLAREHQLLKEKIEPYKDREMVVLTDRFFYGHLVLSSYGRGLDAGMLKQLIDELSNGLKPDITFFLDVDILTSRVRKKIQKIKNGTFLNFGRKGGGGIVLREKMRNGLLELAKTNADWERVENESQSMEEVCYSISQVLQKKFPNLLKRGFRTPRFNLRPLFPLKSVAFQPPLELGKIRESFFQTLRSFNEDVQAYYLCGIGDMKSMSWRKNIYSKAPEMTAESLRTLKSEEARRIFQKLLGYCPRQVITRIPKGTPVSEFAKSVFFRFEKTYPQEVLYALCGVDESWAWEIRKKQLTKNTGYVLASLKGLDTESAWEMRRKYYFDGQMANFLLYSLGGLGEERAWEIRERYREENPAYLLLSLQGLAGARAHGIREKLVAFSPKLVAKSLRGVKDEASYQMREQCYDAYIDVLASIKHDGSEGAQRIRKALWPRFPEGVLSSLGKLYNHTPLEQNVWVNRQWKVQSARLPFLKAIMEREDKKIRVYNIEAVEGRQVV